MPEGSSDSCTRRPAYGNATCSSLVYVYLGCELLNSEGVLLRLLKDSAGSNPSVTLALFISTINLVLYRLSSLFCLIRPSHRPVADDDGQNKEYITPAMRNLVEGVNGAENRIEHETLTELL
ncbi:hypothetical protein J6590_043694 [Homalodisca vitripennis]|nr:hypothetical protein J6590_043694 [Homalodisca vitripennis]